MVTLHVDAMPSLRPGVKEAIEREIGDAVVPTARNRQGLAKAERLELFREEVARHAGCRPMEVVFVSSVTEANVWAIRGARFPGNTAPDNFLVSPLEHLSVIRSAEAFSRSTGAQLRFLPLAENGQVHLEALRKDWPSGRTLVSLQRVNPETGILQPIEEVGRVVRERGGILHCDFSAGQGWEAPCFEGGVVDLMSLSSTVVGGPAGIAALIVRRGVRIEPYLLGGAQEEGRRAGTQPVFLAAGFSAALSHAGQYLEEERKHLLDLDRLFLGAVEQDSPDVTVAGKEGPRRLGVLNLLVPEVDGQALLSLLDREGVVVGTGASCSAQSLTVSPVLTALGYSAREAQGSIVLSLGWWNKVSDLTPFRDALRKGRDLLSRINTSGARA